MATEYDRAVLDDLIAKARAADSPHVDLAPILGLDKPFTVGVDSLHDCLLEHRLPDAVTIDFDGDKNVTVRRIDGGVMATFTMPW